LQQLRSFADMHAAELDTLASEIEAAVPESAQRLKTIGRLHVDEAQLVIDELLDIRTELGERDSASASEPVEGETRVLVDPAVDSPKRARWLAEQAARDEQLRRPRSRRQLLGGVPHPPPSAPPRPPDV